MQKFEISPPKNKKNSKMSVSFDLSLFREIQAWSTGISTVVRNKIEVEIKFLSEFYKLDF